MNLMVKTHGFPVKIFPTKPIQWVCLKIGYIPNYSHLIGIMIINHWVQWGTQHFQTHPYLEDTETSSFAVSSSHRFAAGFLDGCLFGGHVFAGGLHLFAEFDHGDPWQNGSNGTRAGMGIYPLAMSTEIAT